MKPFFSRADFIQVKHLKYIYTKISIKSFELSQTYQLIVNFASLLSQKLQTFLDNYDILCVKIEKTNCEIDYFSSELSELGYFCLKELDNIGTYIDNFVQQNIVFYKRHFNNLINEIY